MSLFHGRRKFLFRLALLFAWMCKPRVAFSLPHSVTSENKGEQEESFPFKTIDYFLNEKAEYDMSFLWFKKAAVGSFRFLREGSGYKAILEAETKGFVGFFTSYRKHVYVTHLTFLPESGKFRSNLFERYVVIKTKEERTNTKLDYEKRVMSWVKSKNGKVFEEKSKPIPEEMVYEDILSAFINFRMGAYGPIKRERKFKVHNIPTKGQSIIDVNITSREEADGDKKLFGKGYDENLLYMKIKVPREIFKSKTGEVSLWIDDRLIPLKGVVKDYIGFGDIQASLINE